MCLHPSIEYSPDKMQFNFWHKIDLSNMCNNSRTSHCMGCLCRYPAIHSRSGYKCNKCGKVILELLDLLWQTRKKIFSVYLFKDFLGYHDLLDLERDVQNFVLLRYRFITDYMFGEYPRSAIFTKFENIGKCAVDLVITKCLRDAGFSEEMIQKQISDE